MKHFNFLTTAALAFTLFAASSLAIHQSASAEGAWSIGIYGTDTTNNFHFELAVGVTVDAADGTADAAAIDICNIEEDNTGDLTPNWSNNSLTFNCDGGNDKDATITNPFDDMCIVMVETKEGGNLSDEDNMGIGIAANCEQALSAAESDCETGGTVSITCDVSADNAVIIELNNRLDTNTAGDLYLVDGDGTVCPANQFDDTADATTPFDCQPATTNGNCEKNNPNLPILIGGTCEATCPEGTIANPEDEAGCKTLLTQDDCVATSATPILTDGESGCTTAGTDTTCAAAYSDMPFVAKAGETATEGSCRAALDCDATDEVANPTTGDCTPCTNGQMADADNRLCETPPLADCEAGQERIIAGGDCVAQCTDTQERFEGNCVAKCESTQDRISTGTCEAKCEDNFVRDPNTEICIEAEIIVLTPQIDGETVMATVEATPLIVEATNTGDFSLNLAADTTLTLTYSKNETGSSPQLTVNSEGIVSFIAADNIIIGGHFIEVIANNQDNTPVATIVLYLRVAAAAGDNTVIPPTSGDTTTEKATGNKGGRAAVIGFVAIGLALWYANADDVAAVNWTPSYIYTTQNGNSSFAVGSRWATTADKMQIYWQTNHSNGNLQYGSGMNYQNGIFAAELHNQNTADKTDLDMSISASKPLGNWTVSGQMAFDMQMSDTETNTNNRLNLSADYTANQWQLSANADADGDLRATANYGGDRWILSATAKKDTKRAKTVINYSYKF